MRLPACFAVLIALAACSPPQVPPTPSRAVEGHTIVSTTLPAARLTVADAMAFVSAKRFLLGSGTDAEQYLFTDAARDGEVSRLMWIQFEHKLPRNRGTYNYPPVRTVEIGGLSFVHDTKVYTDYAGVKPAAGSDVEKARATLAEHGLHLPHAASRVRMFHLPDSDKKSELMVIYMEALPAEGLPAGAGNDMPADEKFPALSAVMLRHLQDVLTISR